MIYKLLHRIWPNLFGWREYRANQGEVALLWSMGHECGILAGGHVFHYASCSKCKQQRAERFGEPVVVDPAMQTFTLTRDRAWERDPTDGKVDV